MKISLVFPRMRYKSGDPPLGMALIASNLRKNGHSVDLVDSTFHPNIEYIQKKLEDFNPNFVAVYVDSMMFNDSTKVMQLAKGMGKKVLAGGPHATLKPQTLTNHADYIVSGEAEKTIVDIIEGKHKSEKIIQAERPDLEKLPMPAYDLLEMKEYMKLWHNLDSINTNLKGTSLMSSRGCPYHCTFCQPVLEKIYGKGVRTRTVESVIQEIKFLKEEYGLQGVFFHDDTFTVKRNWVLDLSQKLIDEKLSILWGINSRIDLLDKELMEKMYEAGLRVIHIGVETGSQRVSDEIYNKGIDLKKVPPLVSLAEKVGIRCLCFFMLGAPGETKEEIKQTIKFAKSLDATEITATICTPLPETYMFESIKDKYKITTDFSQFDYYKNLAYENPDLSFKEIKKLQKKLLLEFYTHPKRWKYIAKHLISPKGIKKMLLKVSRFS